MLNLPKFLPRVKVHVLCAGIPYGNGEMMFYAHMKNAWIGRQLPTLGDGFNLMPTIHVVDIARLIKKLINFPTT